MFLRRRISNRPSGVDYSGAVVGDILCSDLTIVTNANYASSGKTAIGVVVNNASGNLRAIALGEYSKPFGGSGTDIAGLTNYTTSATALTDTDGKGNTALIIAAIGSSTDHAAGFCNSFTTSGTSAGDWYFCALGEVKMFIDDTATINTSLTTVSGTLISVSPTSLVYTSSTEVSDTNNWVRRIQWSDYVSYPKSATVTVYVRPMIKITY